MRLILDRHAYRAIADALAQAELDGGWPAEREAHAARSWRRVDRQHLHRSGDALNYGRWIAGVQFAGEVQDREAVDACPDRGGEAAGVSLHEASLDDRANLLGHCGGLGDALVFAAVARLTEHEREQGGPLQREIFDPRRRNGRSDSPQTSRTPKRPCRPRGGDGSSVPDEERSASLIQIGLR
jgi:hypothetical protein